jgi:uncharacterized protein
VPPRHERSTIDFSEHRDARIAVLSDTHGRPNPALFPVLKKHRPSLILHAGDVGGPELLKELEKISPTIYVRGNVDPAGPAWPDSLSLHITLGSADWVDLLLLHVAMADLRLIRSARDLLQRDPAQIVVFGHSHIPFLGTDGNVTLFNPGSAGPRRWDLPTTIGLIEIAADQLRFKHLDLHTGEEWRPL